MFILGDLVMYFCVSLWILSPTYDSGHRKALNCAQKKDLKTNYRQTKIKLKEIVKVQRYYAIEYNACYLSRLNKIFGKGESKKRGRC